MKKKVLICPLNWGLGHASRMIPVARLLIREGFEVLFATYGASRNLLIKEFPDCKHLNFKGYNVMYSKKSNQVLAMLKLLPSIFINTITEHRKVKKIIRDNEIDIIISDNRFGLWYKEVYSIFVTHQLKVIFPKKIKVFEKLYQIILKKIIKKYDECWIPDFQRDPNLAGVLSHSNNNLKNIHYVGPLSRFSKIESKKNDIDILFILSGPEPQRSILEELIYNEFNRSELKVVLVRGTEEYSLLKGDFEIHNILDSIEIRKLIARSKLVVCRTGYSSVMDLVSLGINAVLIPTPGQTEQEYLAMYLAENRLFYSLNQNEFSLDKILDLSSKKREMLVKDADNLLLERIQILKNKQYNKGGSKS